MRVRRDGSANRLANGAIGRWLRPLSSGCGVRFQSELIRSRKRLRFCGSCRLGPATCKVAAKTETFFSLTTFPKNHAQTMPEHNDNLDAARREYRFFKWVIVLALAVGCASTLSLNLVDPDLWGHVRYGQDWLSEGELPRTATHTFTAVDHPWINHENLAELSFALGYRKLGTQGLLVAKCLWGMGILLLMVFTARRRSVHPLAIWALMLLVASNLQAFFPLRPQLLSFGLCSLALVLCDRAFKHWDEQRTVCWSWLAALPVVFAVWVNSHGAFVAGLCIVGALLGGRIVQLLIDRGEGVWRRIAGLVAVGLSCIGATFANPYGFEMHRWLIKSLGQARPEISEWAAPKISDPIFWPWIALLAVVGFSLFATRHKRDWVQIAILVLVAWQSTMHLRHIAFLAILSGFWLPEHVQSALGRLRPQGSENLPVMRLGPWMRRTAVVVLLVSISLQGFALGRRLTEFPVERDFYPVDAIQFMADQQLHGKLVVSFNWAQYAIAALAPDVQVAFDGRFRTCYPQEVVDMHFDFLLGEFDGKRNRSPLSGPIDGSRVLRHGSPELVLLDRGYETSVEVMQHESQQKKPEWVLLYQDQIAELWGRKGRYDNPQSSEFFPHAMRVADPQTREGSVPWPALPTRSGRGQTIIQQRADSPGAVLRSEELGAREFCIPQSEFPSSSLLAPSS